GGGGGGSTTVETTEYSYFASFAVALSEGPVDLVGRIWLDDRVVDLSDIVHRVYLGTEDQAPDPFIAATEGWAPGYRGTAYIVFERLPLVDFGNRIPQVAAEVFRGVGTLEGLIRGVDLIPGTTEWGYHPEPVRRVGLGSGDAVTSEAPENNHRHAGVSDWSLSLDMLQATLPATEWVTLVVGWFGDDLRAGSCQIQPRIETPAKRTKPWDWEVAGRDRNSAVQVSEIDGRPAFGSSPADRSVIAAIEDLHARGLKVLVYPFVLMDIDAGNTLPDPDTAAPGQPVYPWRGRIRPAAGASVAAEVAAFAGSATASNTSTASGPDWGYRRFILHLARLAEAAGGVEAMVIGTEMVALTQATDTPGVYPFVDELVSLAGEVATVLPSAQIGYAADWSEYHSHRPSDGSGDVFFNLDPLWSSAAIDFIGIDYYLPLSDWREGEDHLDFDGVNGPATIYDLDYLKGNIEGGEYWSWYYASPADRDAQIRTPIADSAHGEDWVFRQKAVRDWHASAHHNRPAGVREATATGWVPGSKPVWFTEIGCPAVALGANQPNVFYAARSSESALPHYSSGIRDDYMARQYLRAALEWWAENGTGIVDPAHVMVWSWDARPWPEFPVMSGIWADAVDWQRGHWWNGRAGAMPAAEAAAERLAMHGIPASALDVAHAHGQVDGYATREPVGFRDWFNPLEVLLRLDAREEGEALAIRWRGAALEVAGTAAASMVDEAGAARYAAIRSAEADRPAAVVLRHADGNADYETAAARADRSDGRGIALAETPLVLDTMRSEAAVTVMLRAPEAAREALAFALPLSRSDVKPGRVLPVTIDGTARPMLVERVTQGDRLQVEASGFDRDALQLTGSALRGFTAPAPAAAPGVSTGVLWVPLNLPALPGFPAAVGWSAMHADPWSGGVLYRSVEEATGFVQTLAHGARSAIGETTGTLAAARPWVFSDAEVTVTLYAGSLVGRAATEVLAGANALALQHPGGRWEVIQFRDAELVAASTWALAGVIRGQAGTEDLAAVALGGGARVVALDQAVRPFGLSAAEAGLPFWYKPGPAGADSAGLTAVAHSFTGEGLRPYAPVHLAAAFEAGDLVVSWTRRTREDGDAWPGALAEVPIGEARERYAVSLGPDGAPALEAVVEDATSLTVTAAELSAAGLAAPFDVRVAQISDAVGPGRAALTTVAA
ncbi:MAG: glycoside hydrolase/phage tail family protein, partial [Pseudomonadota bacterium]